MPDRRYDDGNGLPSLWLQDVIDQRISWMLSTGGTREAFQPGTIPESAIVPDKIVTDLPDVGYSGQVVRVLVNEDAGWVWEFVYSEPHSGIHRWFYKGGSPITNQVPASETTASTTYADLASSGPSVTLPLPGVYRVEIGCSAENDTGGEACFMSPRVGSDTPTDANAVVLDDAPAGGQASISRPLSNYFTTTEADQVISAQYRVSGGTGTFLNRDMVVTPVRVRKAG